MPDMRRPAPEPAPAAGGVQEPASGRVILVVDDDPTVRQFVADILRQRGHEVIAAAGGREALRAVYERSSTPDLVVSGVDMPAMSGIELAARLTADRPGIRIVLMTGRPDSAARARAHTELVSAVLLKPLSLQALLAAVDQVLHADRSAT